MNKGFLSNKNHNLYLKKKLNYKIYTFKDCTQKKKEYELCHDMDCIPNKVSNLGYIELLIGRSPIMITTPTMVCPFGFNKTNNNITLQFTNYKTDNEMNSFYRFIRDLELEQMQILGLDESESELYLSQIRFDKDMKYDPNLLLKIPFRNNKYDIEIRNKDTSCSITNIFKWSKLKCDIYIDKLWKFNGKYVCKWKVNKIMLQ